jgi:hypothetical protein
MPIDFSLQRLAMSFLLEFFQLYMGKIGQIIEVAEKE